tara:strand:+ start:4390 stop:4707 length:318 start_codon:yes stop_codon:yes gene_type:complete
VPVYYLYMNNERNINPATTAKSEVKMTTSQNRDLVVSCLHHSGAMRGRLTADQQQWVRRAADGFGEITGRDDESLDMLWDWSHVRDSSDRAFGRMALVLRAMLEA